MTTRHADQTRARILHAAFEEIHHKGFHGASLDAILAHTQVTKGALYHHFANKDELGFAVVDEIIGDYIRDRWIRPMRGASDPVRTLIELLTAHLAALPQDMVRLGCPLNNLNQEMSAQSEPFRKHIEALYTEWRSALADSFRTGQSVGSVRPDIDPDAVATFIVASNQGLAGMMKSSGSADMLRPVLSVIIDYLETLRPKAPSRE
jgi:AcrR family transcriptional regulator